MLDLLSKLRNKLSTIHARCNKVQIQVQHLIRMLGESLAFRNRQSRHGTEMLGLWTRGEANEISLPFDQIPHRNPTMILKGDLAPQFAVAHLFIPLPLKRPNLVP